MARYDAVIVGGGHNGLVAAAYLARAGRRVVVLEAASVVGGCAINTEIAPGFQLPALAHAMTIDAQVSRDLGLAGRGLTTIAPAVSVFAPTPSGKALVLWRDTARSAHDLAGWSAADAAKWPEFMQTANAIANAAGGLLKQIPPSIDSPSAAELVQLFGVGRGLRGLGRSGLYRFLRWGPMAIADLASEWFETPVLRAAIAARGIFGVGAGPRSAGTVATWLLQTALEGHPAGAPVFASGGPAALGRALAAAATAAGATIRTGARVTAIDANDSGATGVTIEGGERFEAGIIVSNADPRRTLLDLVDPIRLPPSFREKIRRFRSRGVLAKINLALSRLPSFAGVDKGQTSPAELLAGRIHIGPDLDYMERAFDASKYGRYSPSPWLEATIPSLGDASLAPAGQHVMSVYAQWMPYQLRGSDWATEREAMGDAVVKTLAAVAPDLPSAIVARTVVTPQDLERQYGLSGGHIFHGEHALDQLYAMRPVLGWAQHRTPIAGLYLCGAGTHPGGGLTGLPGAHAARVVLKDPRR